MKPGDVKAGSAGEIRPTWREDLGRWCADFSAMLEDGWEYQGALHLFERIESLSALAELMADAPVAEATAELTVYLCAFADSDVRPDANQGARLQRLVEDLVLALGGDTREPDVGSQPAAAPSRHFLVHYVRPPERDQPGLAAAMGQQRIGVLPLPDIETALQALAREQPDVVLLDATFLKSLQLLSEAARRHSTGNWRRVLWVATGIGEDVHLRLFARRAGIDLILGGEAPEHAAATVLSSLLRRREQAYRVLMVEDDRGHITFCTSILRHQGFEVDVAETGESALEQLQNRVPDLILLDINLPDINGVELAQLMREQDSLSNVPIVFLTGEENMDLRAEAIAAGGDDFLSKPVRPRHLIANVNSRVGRARALAMAAQREPLEDGLSPRLDRIRFVESMDNLRRNGSRCAGVAVIAMDDVGEVASQLGFVRTGDLALQIGLAIESEAGGRAQTCGIGEFSRLVLIDAESERGLRNAADSLRARLESRAWLSTSFPLRAHFSAAVVRYDGSPLDADAIIAEVLALLDATRRERSSGVGFRNVAPIDDDASDPIRRIARAILSQPLKPGSGQLQFRPLLPMRGSRAGQFLLRTVLVPPGARLAARIEPEQYLDIAGSLGVNNAIDRLSLGLMKHYSQSALVATQGWTALLPISEHLLQEPLFPDWLQREGLKSSDFRIVVRAERLRAGSGLAAAIDRVAQRGWRWVLEVDSPTQFDYAVLSLGNLESLLINNHDAADPGWSEVIAAAVSHGKSVIITGVDDVRQVSSLFALGAHYAVGATAGEWSNEPNFEAARPREL